MLGTENPADLMTKHLNRDNVDSAIDNMGQVVQEGRANSSLDIQGKANALDEIKHQDTRAKTKQWEATWDGGACASSTEADHWKADSDQVVRVHVQPRDTLFAVTVADASLPRLQRHRRGPVRTKRGRDQTGNDFVLHDYWRAAKHPRRRQPFRWTGTTIFHTG